MAVDTPALGQERLDHLTFAIPGAGPHDRTLSEPVSYGDLDLTTKGGQIALRQRVRLTAAKLCHEAGDDAASAAAFTCEDRALKNVGAAERAAIARASSRDVLAEVRGQPGR
jgi:UrcA family protein